MSFSSIWEYKLQILPVLLALLLTETPNIIRKYKRFYYIPIYFSIFPLRELNPNLAIYLGDDYFLKAGSSLKDKDVAKIKRKIIVDSAIAMFISAIAIPSIAGFVFSFFLNEDLLTQSIFVILVYKMINIIRSVWGFKGHAIASKKNIILLIVIYIAYLGVFFQLLNNSYEWARPFIITNNYRGLITSLSDLIFNKGIAQGLILTALGAFFGTLITDKKIRDENIKKNEEYRNS